MLNTDLHSYQIKNKMTLETFIQNTKTFSDIPADYLTTLYHDVIKHGMICQKAREFQNYVKKVSRVLKFIKNERTVWCVIKNGKLCLYPSQQVHGEVYEYNNCRIKMH